MGINDKDLFGNTKYEKSIKILKEYCTGKKVLCAFSGGKDSQCCYHLLKDAGIPFDAQYSITRFEPPELMQFIRDNYPDVKFRRAYTMSLFEQIRKYGLPNRFYRYCCDAKHKKTDGYDIAVIGVRAEESAKRRSNWRIFGQKQDKTFYCCPIFGWTEDDVWDYLNKVKDVPHCRLYDEGYKRIGCVMCPLSMKMHDQDAKRYPKIVNNLRNAFFAYYEDRKMNGFHSQSGKFIPYLANTTKEVLFDNWIRGGMHVLQTSDTRSVEGEEQCIFEGTGFSESDGSSSYEEDEQ